MAISSTPVQTVVKNSVGGGVGNTLVVSTGSNVTAGNALIACVTMGANLTVTFTSTGDTWVTIATFWDATIGQMVAIGRAVNVTGGAKTVTATWTSTGGNFRSLYVAEFSGVDPSSPDDVHTTGRHNSAATNYTDASMTTTAAGDLIIGMTQNDGATAVTAGSGFTLLGTFDSNTLSVPVYQIQASAGAVSTAFVGNTSHASMTVSAAFKAAGGSTQNGTVAFAVATALAVTPIDTLQPAVGFAVGVGVAVTPQVTHQAAIGLAVATSVGVTPSVEHDAAVGLAVGVGLAVTPSVEHDAAVPFAVATAVTVTPNATYQPPVPLAVATGLAVTPQVTHQATAPLAVATALTVTPQLERDASISLAVATILRVIPTTTYYVSAAGSNSNDGLTTGTPWATIGKVNAATLHPGDSVLFRGGDTFTDALLYLNVAASAATQITIGSYGTGRATLTFATNNAVFVDGVGGYVFQDIDITGTTGSTAYAGVNCFGNGTGQLPSLSFLRCSISGWQTGLDIGGQQATDGYNGITIDSVDASGNLYGGCSIFNLATFNAASPVYAHSNVSITNSTFDNNTGDASITTFGTGSGLSVANVNGGTAVGVEAHGNGANNGDTSSGPVGIWVSKSNNFRVQLSLAYTNHSGTSVDGDGFDLDEDCTNCWIEYCLSYGNDGAGILLYGAFSDSGWANNGARYNVTFGNGKTNSSYGEMTLGGLITNPQVYGNTCISKDGASTFPSPLLLQYTPGMTGGRISNNIFYGGGFGDLVYDGSGGTSGQVEMQGNLYYSPHTTTIHWGTDYTSLAAWQAATGQEKLSGSPVGLMADPKLTSPTTAPTVTSAASIASYVAARLLAASPAIGAGLDLLTLFSIDPGTRDFYGDTLATPLPIGADLGPSVSVAFAIGVGLSVTGTAERDAAASLAVATTMTVTPQATYQPPVPLAVATSLTVTPQVTHQTTVPLAVASALTVTPMATYQPAIALAVATALAVTPQATYQPPVGLAVATALAVTAQIEHDAAVGLDVACILGVTTGGQQTANIALAVATALTVTGQATYQPNVALAVAAALAIAPQVTHQAAVTLAVATALTAGGSREVDATVGLAVATALTVTPQHQAVALAALAVATALSTTGSITRTGGVLFAVAAILAVSAEPPPVIPWPVTPGGASAGRPPVTSSAASARAVTFSSSSSRPPVTSGGSTGI